MASCSQPVVLAGLEPLGADAIGKRKGGLAGRDDRKLAHQAPAKAESQCGQQRETPAARRAPSPAISETTPPHPDLPSRGALGNGVADDKAMYCYVPRMIEFYLGEHAILNNVLTYMLRDPKQRKPVTLVPGPEAVGC